MRSDSWNLSEEIKIQAYARLSERFGEYHIPYRERLGETKLVPWKVGLENLSYFIMMRLGIVGLMQSYFKKPPAPRRLPTPAASKAEQQH